MNFIRYYFKEYDERSELLITLVSFILSVLLFIGSLVFHNSFYFSVAIALFIFSVTFMSISILVSAFFYEDSDTHRKRLLHDSDIPEDIKEIISVYVLLCNGSDDEVQDLLLQVKNNPDAVPFIREAINRRLKNDISK